LVSGEVFMLEGGHDYDGRPIVPFDEIGMSRAARRIRNLGIRSVAVAAVFSPLDPSCEERARAILAEECPDAAVTLSRDLGRIGLLERENAALLSAALVELARVTVAGFTVAITASGISAQLYLTQNDGTLMSADVAASLPVMSFASGATNSMRGAAFSVKASRRDGDRCRWHLNGFWAAASRLSARGQLGRLDERRAHTVSHAGYIVDWLGGGSVIEPDPLAVGPQSVGYRLTRDALAFGGQTMTATDVAVAAGLVEIGNPSAVAALPRDLARAVLEETRRKIENLVDQMNTEATYLPLIAVGGAAFLVPDWVAGTSEVIRVPNGDWPMRWAPRSRKSAVRLTRSIAISAVPRRSRPAKRKLGSAR
jgi:N-methylhydantoinase A/oxoprolinase/acetone carboxylase beta subunit